MGGGGTALQNPWENFGPDRRRNGPQELRVFVWREGGHTIGGKSGSGMRGGGRGAGATEGEIGARGRWVSRRGILASP